MTIGFIITLSIKGDFPAAPLASEGEILRKVQSGTLAMSLRCAAMFVVPPRESLREHYPLTIEPGGDG